MVRKSDGARMRAVGCSAREGRRELRVGLRGEGEFCVLVRCAFQRARAHPAHMQACSLAHFFSPAKMKELKLTVDHGEYGKKEELIKQVKIFY